MLQWIRVHSTDWQTMIPVALVFGFSAAWLAWRKREVLIPWLTLAVCLASGALTYAVNHVHASLGLDRAYWGTIVAGLWIGVLLQLGIMLTALAVSRFARLSWAVRGSIATMAGVTAIPIVNLVTEHLYRPFYVVLSQLNG